MGDLKVSCPEGTKRNFTLSVEKGVYWAYLQVKRPENGVVNGELVFLAVNSTQVGKVKIELKEDEMV